VEKVGAVFEVQQIVDTLASVLSNTFGLSINQRIKSFLKVVKKGPVNIEASITL
jgi:hypothetical protein